MAMRTLSGWSDLNPFVCFSTSPSSVSVGASQSEKQIYDVKCEEFQICWILCYCENVAHISVIFVHAWQFQTGVLTRAEYMSLTNVNLNHQYKKMDLTIKPELNIKACNVNTALIT